VDPSDSEVVNLVARTTAGRQLVRERMVEYGIPFASLVSPDVDTYGAEIPEDITVYQNATVGPEVTIADGTVVFMGAVVGHECTVGPGCVLAANSVLNARVELGREVYVGTNATVLPEIRVGAGATIGAGSVVVQDVPPGATVMGVPAQILFDGSSSAGGKREVKPVGDEASIETDSRTLGGKKEVENAIARIWEDVLGIDAVGLDDGFFDVGGKSLDAVRIAGRLQQSIAPWVALVDIFRFPTVRSLARHLLDATSNEPAEEPLAHEGEATVIQNWASARRQHSQKARRSGRNSESP
jgi:acetyltransferase-like isoleucine patch superfamily enzyme